MTETTQLWLDLANQLMLAFLLLLAIGFVAGYFACWLRERKRRKKLVQTLCERRQAGYLADGNQETGLEGSDIAALFQFRDRLK